MSARRTHRTVGTFAGGGYALARARHQPTEHVLLEVIGGLLAGALGARLPDVFDPPIHPGHRGLAHGVLPVTAAGVAAVTVLNGWQDRLRAEADRRAALRASAATPLERLWHGLLAWLSRIGAGALAGIIAGYGSHVILDAVTPASLPLFA